MPRRYVSFLSALLASSLAAASQAPPLPGIPGLPGGDPALGRLALAAGRLRTSGAAILRGVPAWGPAADVLAMAPGAGAGFQVEVRPGAGALALELRGRGLGPGVALDVLVDGIPRLTGVVPADAGSSALWIDLPEPVLPGSRRVELRVRSGSAAFGLASLAAFGTRPAPPRPGPGAPGAAPTPILCPPLPPRPPGALAVERFFPRGTGASWRYVRKDGSLVPAVAWRGSTDRFGVPAMELSEPAAGWGEFHLPGPGIRLVALLTPRGIADFRDDPIPLAVGPTVFTGDTYHARPDSYVDSTSGQHLLFRTMVGGLETVAVPAGKFEGCLTFVISATGEASGELVWSEQRWYAPGVGLVARRTVSRAHGEAVEKLVAYHPAGPQPVPLPGPPVPILSPSSPPRPGPGSGRAPRDPRPLALPPSPKGLMARLLRFLAGAGGGWVRR